MPTRFTRGAAAAALVAALAVPALAGAQTFDFEALATGPVPGATLVQTNGGVTATFTGAGLQIRQLGAPFGPGARRVLSSNDDAALITMTLSQAVTGITFRNWISGVYTGEVDVIVVRAFDAANNLLGTVTSSSEFISLNAAGIVRVTWDDVPDGEGYVLDEITLRGVNQNVVPEPGTYALMATGLAGLAAVRRRRRA